MANILAIDRSPQGLVDALCRRIETLLAPSFWYEAEQFEHGDNEEYHTPHVHAQYLPVSKTALKERDKSKDYPIVQIVCITGIISNLSEVQNGSEIAIHIYFGGYSKDTDNQGWRIPMSMLWRTLQNLLSDTICEGYKLDTPIKWSSQNASEPPYYTATLETVWKGAPPAVEVPNEDNVLFTRDTQEETPTDQAG